jgi:hypothetical protein
MPGEGIMGADFAVNRTKMFHVKHFGTILAKDLTRGQTAASLKSCKIDGFACPIATRDELNFATPESG